MERYRNTFLIFTGVAFLSFLYSAVDALDMFIKILNREGVFEPEDPDIVWNGDA